MKNIELQELTDDKEGIIANKYSLVDYLTLKPFRNGIKKQKIDYLSTADFNAFRFRLVNRFAPFIEKVQSLDESPNTAGIIVKGYRNIIMSFAIALAHPNTDFLAEDGFENLLLLMIEDLHFVLGNEKLEFQTSVQELATDLVQLIYINKTDRKFAPESPVFIKNLEIGQAKLFLDKQKQSKTVTKPEIDQEVEIDQELEVEVDQEEMIIDESLLNKNKISLAKFVK